MAMNEQTISAVKGKAEAYFSKGKLKEAIEAYESIKSYAGKDPRISLRIGEIYRKIGKNNEAIDAYKLAADAFITQGFITKAIGVCKVIIDIDPAQADVQRKIAELYTKKGFVTGTGKKAGEEKPSGDAGREAGKFPRTPLFSDLGKDELVTLIGKVRYQTVSQGEFVFKEGDSGDSIYIINSGEVEIISRDRRGNDVVLSTLKEGDFFGEFGFFSNARREASVRAKSPASLLEIVKKDITDIIERHRRVAGVIFDFYKERVVDRLMALSAVFEPVTPGDRKVILARLTSSKYESGATIVRQGDIGDTMYLIKEGKVRVWLNDPLKGNIEVTTLSEGDFFGEIALATSRPRVANVTAITDTELVLFSRPMIKDILAKYPDIKKIMEDVIKARVTDVIKVKGLQSAALI
jgi:cAMP-dependent protein kinase regulator